MVDKNNSGNNDTSSVVLIPMAEYPECGYRILNMDRVDSRLKCIFCSLIIENPIQLTECGHRSCRDCFEYRAGQTTDGNVTCPCENCHLITNKTQIMIDKAFKRELDNINIACMYQLDQKCPWTGLLKDYRLHLDQMHCVHICLDCHENFPSNLILHEHRTRTCPAIFEFCSLTPLCVETMIRKDEFASHCLTEIHQEAITKAIAGKYTFDNTASQQHNLELMSIQREREDQITERAAQLLNQVQKVSDETIQLHENSSKINERVQHAAQELHNYRARKTERLTIMQTVQQNQGKLQKEVEEIYEAFETYQHISTDGTLTWRIQDVSDKIADAQSERQPSIYSPIFYSSPTGYRMRARLFLFGDGNARRTHMSLFFLILKGEHDAILKWPFNYKITFCLLDQTGNNNHVIDSFHPDVKSNSFQRPKTDTNVANGIPKFFPLTMIQQDNNPYVREDTMYLKIFVELNETSKLLLPFVLTLNPALPNHVQEHLIQQESIKRQQRPTTNTT